MKLWIDDQIEAPVGYHWAGSIELAQTFIEEEEAMYNLWHQPVNQAIQLINMPEGDPRNAKMQEWLQATGRNYPIITHKTQSFSEKIITAVVGQELTLVISECE